jgi:ubiquinol-cytochrome c reductase iron-sulfur subunit
MIILFKVLLPAVPVVQKRGYAGPVHVHNQESITSPPPNQKAYMKDMSTYDDQASRNTTYFMVGSLSAVGAMAAKNTITDILVNMSASADVLALSKVEVNLASIPEGKNVVLKWRGKPIFIRHRTAEGFYSINDFFN